jgi:hypothetical protein
MGSIFRYDEIGLPVGHAYPELQFQPTIGVIVARTRSLDFKSPVTNYRLSARHKNEAKYHPICDMDDSKSVLSFAVCLAKPVLYFSVHEVADGGNRWEGLYRHCLETEETVCIINYRQFSPASSEDWQWISDLYSVTTDGLRVFCQTCKVPKIGGKVQFSLSEFCTISLSHSVVCEMADPCA